MDLPRDELGCVTLIINVFVVIFGLGGVYLILQGNRLRIDDPRFGVLGPVMSIIGLLLALIPGVMIFRAARLALARHQLGSVMVEHTPTDLVAGDDVTCHMSFCPRIDVHITDLNIGVVGFEFLIAGFEESSRTKTKLLHQEFRRIDSNVSLTAGASMEYSTTLKVPDTAQVSVEGTVRTTRWELVLDIQMRGSPTVQIKSHSGFTSNPTLAGRQRRPDQLLAS